MLNVSGINRTRGEAVELLNSSFVSDNPLSLYSPASFDRFVVGAAERPET